jgi:hypothetical protein
LARSVPLSRFTPRVGGGSAFFVRHRSHFMRTSHFIIIGVSALAAMFSVGCSKSSSPPTITFAGYKVESGGMTYAECYISNPNQSPIVCQLEVQPRDPSPGGPRDFVIPARGSLQTGLYVSNTNALSLSVTVLRTVPAHHLTVPMQ